MARNQKDFTIDLDTQLKDAGLIAADDDTQVDSSDVILDLGDSRVDGRVIIDASAVEVASGDEIYDLILEFSDESDHGSDVIRGPSFRLGDAAVLSGNADTDNGAGRYELPFCNEINGTTYRYMRMHVDVSGTIATGINFTAWVVKA